MPGGKALGDGVCRATINKLGGFRFEATKVGKDTALRQIVKLVQDAQGSKAPIARLADVISGIFTPIVLCIAVATFVVWFMASPPELCFPMAFVNAIGVLVPTCPCPPGPRSPPPLPAATRRRLKGGAGGLCDRGCGRGPLGGEPGQFSGRGGILDVFPAAGRAPVRAEFFGDEIESLRLFDPGNQRSVMSVPRVTVRPGRELALGAERGARAVSRIRPEPNLDHLRGDVRAEWEDDLARIGAGSSFPGLE